MKNIALKALLVASVLMPVAALAQGSSLKTTVITKEDIDKINQSEQSLPTKDENAMVIDIGGENFSLGIIHRGSTHTPPPARPAGANANAAAAEPCGTQMANVPADAIRGGLTHDHQTEGYYIISGGGTMMVDGYIVNGRHSMMPDPGGPNGPSCGGMAVGSRKINVKVGDVIIVPAGVVHGWADIPDHADYLSFRPSQHVMQAGWVNPTIAKK
jgi:mannose-6-phosphate isomerase-like protein (cupin superfamily)